MGSNLLAGDYWNMCEIDTDSKVQEEECRKGNGIHSNRETPTSPKGH